MHFYSYDFPSCYLLDPIRALRRKKDISTIDLYKEECTKRSGIYRDNNQIFRFLSNERFLYPLMKFQELFYKYDWGSAFILACKRID